MEGLKMGGLEIWNPIQWLRDNWNVESYPVLEDMWAMLAVACIFPLIRFFLDTFLYEPVGRYFIFKKARDIGKKQPGKGVKAPLLKNGKSAANGDHKAGPGSTKSEVPSVESIDQAALEKTHYKFKESCWKSLYYTSALALALWTSAGEPWLSEPKFYFLGPGDLVWPDQTMKLKLKMLFMYCGGFYTYSIFALIFWETRRKDFVVSMVHHVASVALSSFAFLFRFGRPAALVVAIHDTSDIFLECAKLSRYLNIESLASVFFVLFAGSWAVLRLWFYPRSIVFASSYVVLKVLDKRDHTVDGPPLYYIFNTILQLLLFLHIYWWILIVRVLIRQIGQAGKVEGDVRSEDDSDDD